MSPDMNMDLTNMPMLTSLYLRIVFKETDEPRQINVNLVRSSRLRCLSLIGHFAPQFNVKPVYTLIKRVTFDSWNYPPSYACLDLLRTAPNIKRFHVNSGESAMAQMYIASTQIANNLKTLVLFCGPARVVLPNVILPALKHLYYNYASNEPRREPMEDLLNFARRSMPPLTSLEVKSDLVTESTLIHVFRLLPTLQAFRSSRSTISKRFFRALTVRSNTDSDNDPTNGGVDIICPGLEFLHMDCLEIPDDKTEWVTAACNMLLSRWKVLRSFKRAGTWQCNFDVPTIYDRRDEFQDAIINRWEFQAEGDGTYMSVFEAGHKNIY